MQTRSFMHSAAIVLAGALLFAISAPAQAQKDFCFVLSGGLGATLAAKNFKLPKKATCLPVHGFCTTCTQPNTVTGTACTNEEGTNVYFTLVLGGPGFTARFLFSHVVTVSTMTGSGSSLLAQAVGNSANLYDVAAEPCTAPLP